MKKTKVLSLIIALMLIFTSTIVFAEGESTDTETDDGDTATFELEMDTETGETEFYVGDEFFVIIKMKESCDSIHNQQISMNLAFEDSIFELNLSEENEYTYEPITETYMYQNTDSKTIFFDDENNCWTVCFQGIAKDNYELIQIPFKVVKADTNITASISLSNISSEIAVGDSIDTAETKNATGSCNDLEIEILEGTRPDDSEEGDTEEGDTEEGDTEEGEEEGISEIVVDEEPDTTEYTEGDVFDPDGMQFTVKYLNDDEKTIAVVVDDDANVTLVLVDEDGEVTEKIDSGLLTWEPKEGLTTDDDKIVFTYTDEEENEAEFEIEITVTEEEPEEPTEEPEEPTKPTGTSKSDSEPKKETTAKEDSKEATGKIPQTGMPSIIIPSAIGIALVIVAVVSYKKYKKLF